MLLPRSLGTKGIAGILLVAALAICGCAGKSVYVPPGETTQMDATFSDTDMRTMAQSMYNSLQSRLVSIRPADAPLPIVGLLHIENNTSEHIDTDMIADKLQVELLRAGTMRFVDRSRIKAMAKEFDLGGSGFVDPAQAKSAGQALGIDYFLYGQLGSIKKREGKKELNYYRVSMKLTDASTNEVVWAEDYEVKKQYEKPFIEW
jgi:uncharacterized protein (TIGR02722 family)